MLRVLSLFVSFMFLGVTADADIYKYESDDGAIVYTDTPLKSEASLFIKSRPYASRSINTFSSNLYDNIKRYYPIVKKMSKEYAVDPDLIRAIITVESNWSPRAVSPKGAMGLMQLMPLTAKSLSVHNAFDPEENISGGVRYFRMLLDLFGGNLSDALAAYNAGPTRVKNKTYFPEGSETRKYISKVLSLYGGEDKFEYAPLDRQLDVRPIFKMVLEDGTLLFTDSPLVSGGEVF